MDPAVLRSVSQMTRLWAFMADLLLQFVNFTDLAERAAKLGFAPEQWEAAFALRALMEVPEQYRQIVRGGMLGRCHQRELPQVVVHDPPP
jgi:Copine